MSQSVLPTGLKIAASIDAADVILIQGASFDYQIAAGTFASQMDALSPNPQYNTLGVGTSTINSKAVLELLSTTKGFLPPRMTSTQRDAIVSPPEGLVIYNTTTHKLNVYTGSAWEAVTSA